MTTAHRQLAKTGGTEFTCTGIEIDWQEVYFVPVATWNALRRSVLEKLTAARAQNRPVLRRTIHKNDAPYPEKQLTYLGNVLNQKAEDFYRRHGVTQIEPAAESGLDMHGRQVMRTRYCLRLQLGLCRREDDAPVLKEPLYLVDEDGRRFELRFDCQNCEMEICLTPQEEAK
jgi:putative protease